MSAAGNNFTDCVRVLVDKGARLETQNENGETALYVAAMYNAQKTTQLLLDLGANVNHKGASNDTALMWACAKNSVATSKMLVENGINLNAQDKSGVVPNLCFAAGQRADRGRHYAN